LLKQFNVHRMSTTYLVRRWSGQARNQTIPLNQTIDVAITGGISVGMLW